MAWIALLRRGLVGYGLVLVGQVLSAIAGLLFVNVLSTEEFALFAVCTALLQAIVAQSDLGTLAAVGFFYRESCGWDSFRKNALPAIADIRLKFFLAAAIVLTAFFIVSGAAQNASPMRAAVLLALTLGGAWFGMANAIQIVALRVRGDVNIAVAIDAFSGFIRLCLSIAMVAMQLLSAEAALCTSFLSSCIAFTVGRRFARDVPLGIVGQDNKGKRKEVFRYAVPLIPGSLYYTLQPSILIWLSMIYGNTQRVAEVGALGRIGQIISFVGFGLNLFVLPHMAGLREERAFRRSYLMIGLTVLGVGAAALLAIMSSRNVILMLLGPKYAGLDTEVVLVAATALLNIVAQYAVLINRVRGWNRLEPLSTVMLFFGQAGLIALLPLGSTAGILWLGFFYAAWVAVVNFAINIVGFWKPALATVSLVPSAGARARRNEDARYE